MDQETSEYIGKGPCNSCGSSDACATYSDGHTWCFSCGNYEHGEGSVLETDAPVRERPKSLLGVSGYPGWQSRGLTAETCRKWGIGITEWDGKACRAFVYRDAAGTAVAQKVRPAKKNDMRFLGEPKSALPLFGQWLWRDKGKRVVITEGEIDAASVSQVQGHKWPVVSIPNGAQGAKKSLQKAMDWLSGFDEVVLMFDNDEPGRAAAMECAPLFKPGTCKIATLELKDASDMLKAGKAKEIVDAIWGAKTYRPDGILMGSDLWDRLSTPKKSFGLPYPWQGLQAKTQGVRLGELVTITAGSGIGKSAVVRELAYNLLVPLEATVGMLMFEETVERTALGLMSIDMNRNLTLMGNPQNEAGFEESFRRTAGSGRLVLYDHFGSTAIDNVLDRIRYMATGLGCQWIVLDHLSILISGMEDGDERRLIDNAMTALKSLAMELNIGLFLVSHLKRPEKKGHEEGATTSLSQLRGSHAIAQLSDLVLGLERNQQDEKYRDITQLRVLKNRWTGETGVAGWLRYDRNTGRLYEELSDPREGGEAYGSEDNPF